MKPRRAGWGTTRVGIEVGKIIYDIAVDSVARYFSACRKALPDLPDDAHDWTSKGVTPLAIGVQVMAILVAAVEHVIEGNIGSPRAKEIVEVATKTVRRYFGDNLRDQFRALEIPQRPEELFDNLFPKGTAIIRPFTTLLDVTPDSLKVRGTIALAGPFFEGRGEEDQIRILSMVGMVVDMAIGELLASKELRRFAT